LPLPLFEVDRDPGPNFVALLETFPKRITIWNRIINPISTWILLFNCLTSSLLADSHKKHCSLESDCQTCVRTPICGWCESVCLDGDERGPFDNRTVCHFWLFGSTEAACVTHVQNPKRCEHLNNCSSCLQTVGCYWCPFLGCHDTNRGCCPTCDTCRFPRTEHIFFQRFSVSFLVAAAVIASSLLLAAIVHGFYQYYWLRRHYFEVLE
jgi:hypothetical protein